MKSHVASCKKIGGNSSCAIEDLVWRYARRNLAVLNIFIKVPDLKAENSFSYRLSLIDLSTDI